jgi:5'-nucleotidase
MTRQHRQRRVAGLAIAVVAGLLTMLLPASMGAANAKPPPKPGTISDLTLSAAMPATSYRVTATWTAAPKATGYRVTLSNATGTLDQATVSTTAFTGTAPAELVGTSVRVQVTPLNESRRGRATAKSLVLPDLTAPEATYTLAPQNSLDGNVTITQVAESLKDNVSAADAVTQSVDWGDGSAASTDNGTVTSFAHTYPSAKQVYYPVVTVTDAAGNSRQFSLTAVVGDYDAPTGEFSAAPGKAWAKWTQVTLTQDSLADDLSLVANISRSVDWGDGVTQSWLAGTTLRHRYKVAGEFTPQVTITDEAGNAATLSTTRIVVTVDSIAPGLRLTLPKLGKTSVRKWTTLKGRSRDFQTGVRKVRIKAVEKRGEVWYAYKPLRKVWVRAGATKAKAFSKAPMARVSTTDTHNWSLQLRKLTKGTLVYKVSSVDQVNNVTKWKVHRQVLSRR